MWANLLEKIQNMLLFVFHITAHYKVPTASRGCTKGPYTVAMVTRMKVTHGPNSMGHLLPRSLPNAQPAKSRVWCWTLTMAFSPEESSQPLTGRLIYQTTPTWSFVCWKWYLLQIWDCFPGLQSLHQHLPAKTYRTTNLEKHILPIINQRTLFMAMKVQLWVFDPLTQQSHHITTQKQSA